MDVQTFDVKTNKVKEIANAVFTGSDEELKIKLLKELKEITKIGKKSVNPKKKQKIDISRRVDLPNEIWTKIINYMSTYDVFGNLALVNKHLHQLTLEPGTLKYLKIIRLYMHESNAIDILKRSATLQELTLKDVGWAFEKTIKEVFSMCQTIKSLKISNVDCWNEHKDAVNEVFAFEGPELSMEFIESLKEFNIQLEHLELQGIFVPSDIMIEISKIKTLRSLRLWDARFVVFSPEVIYALANNENKYEALDFFDKKEYDNTAQFFSHFPEGEIQFLANVNIALNCFIQKKAITLKSLKIEEHFLGDEHFKTFLENLSMCHNLEELVGEFKDIPFDESRITPSELPRLKRLAFDFNENPKLLLRIMNFSQLRYLKLNGYSEVSIFKQLKKYDFPFLERLYVQGCKVSPKELEKFVTKAPILKSIQLTWCKNTYLFTDDFLYNTIKESNVLIFFGSILKNPYHNKYEIKLESFEEFLMEHDLSVFQKYCRMKISFTKWCERNPEYGH